MPEFKLQAQGLQKPTFVFAHNKTLAAQLYGEFKEMFPENAVDGDHQKPTI